MTAFALQCMLLGSPIRMQFTPLDHGIHILLTGGQCSHVGAVALAENGRLIAGASFPRHREQQVADLWATALSAEAQTPVTVACGIHYDDATPAQIREILRQCDTLLAQTRQALQKQKTGDNDEI